MRLHHRLLIERVLIIVVIAALVGIVLIRTTNQEEKFEADIAEEYVAIAERVIPAVVAVTAADNNSASYGSGMIISEDGYILTNYHVVANTTKLRVILPSNEIYAAKIIGSDPPTDLTIIKINASHLPIITFGDSDVLKVGAVLGVVALVFGSSKTR